MWKQIKNIIAVLLVVVFLLSLCLNVHFYSSRQERIAVSDTTRVTIFDTIPYLMPVPKDSIVIRYITEKLPISTENGNSGTENGNSGTGNGNSGTGNGQIIPGNILDDDDILSVNIPDSAEVTIPITQKIYETELYKAYVSGYRPSLDSLLIFQQTQIIHIKDNPKPKRWGIGIQVGYGVTMSRTPQFSPYIGVGISYNLFNF